MNTLKKKTNFFLVFLVFFLSTRASGLSLSNLFLFGSLLLNIGVAVKRRITIDKPFIVFIAFFLLVVLQNFIRLDEYFNLFRYFKFLSLIFIAYLTIKIVQLDFFAHFNKVVYYAILFSIPFYCWQLVSVESFHHLGKMLNGTFAGLMDVSDVSNNQSLNVLFYTIEYVENFRNSGPMWEPGGFATVIVLSLLFELMQRNYTFNKRCWIYIVGIFITFSTTGYLTTLIVVFFYLLKKAQHTTSRYLKPVLYLFLPAFLLVSGVIFYNTPIFYEKIVGEIGIQNNIIENLSDYGDSFQSLGRFGSLQMDLQSIQDKFIFGRGYTDEDFRQKYEQFNFTNGLSSFIGRMGLVGLVWLLFSLFKSGKLVMYGLTGTTNGSSIFMILVITISFSNPVLFTPLFLVLQLFFIPFKLQTHAKYQVVHSDSGT